ncbi:hypothetical protein EDD85DRAFT_784148 [Armillaria nabsnona]|nr:hypothetical protein EDD85DRAFT_784148 [Armillaria nabsnona]
MSVERQLDHRDMDILRFLALPMERWSVLELAVTGKGLSRRLSLGSSPDIHLTKHFLYRVGDNQPETNYAVVNIHSFFLIAHHRNPSSTSSLFVYANQYEPFAKAPDRSDRLIEFIIELASPLDGLINTASISYPPMIHTSLQRLSFDMELVNPHPRTNIPVTIDYITLPALRDFEVPAASPGVPWSFQAIEYTRLIGLFHRSQCSLTIPTISVPMSVEAFLIPVLSQSPALRRLDIFLNASIAGDVFKALSLEQGAAPCLEQLYITDTPIRMENRGLLEDAGGFHEMILSRLGGDIRLDTLHLSLKTDCSHQPLALPVPQDSPFCDLFRIKDQGMNVKFFLDMKDRLVDEEARASFFCSS